MGVTIPDSSPSDNPLTPILINPKWLPILIGLCMDSLLSRSYWEGTESEIDLAIDYADELIYLFSGSESEVSLVGLVGASWLLESASGRFEAYDSARLLASFNPSSPDALIPLKLSGDGGTTPIDTVGTGSRSIGDVTGDQWVGQSFIPAHSGRLSEISIRLMSNENSPVGNIAWEIRTNASGSPSSTILSSGSFTPVANTTIVIPVINGFSLDTGSTYWMIFRCQTVQTGSARYNLGNNTAEPYTSGLTKFTRNNGSSWSTTSGDLRLTITTSAVINRDKLAQAMMTDTDGDLDTAHVWLRKQGSPTGNLTLKLYTDASGEPGSLLSTSDTITVASLGSSFAMQTFTFSTPYGLTANTVYWLVLESTHTASTSNWVEWQANSTT